MINNLERRWARGVGSEMTYGGRITNLEACHRNGKNENCDGDLTSLAGDRERAYSDNIQACRRNGKNQSWDGDSTSSTRGRSKRQVTTLPR